MDESGFKALNHTQGTQTPFYPALILSCLEDAVAAATRQSQRREGEMEDERMWSRWCK